VLEQVSLLAEPEPQDRDQGNDPWPGQRRGEARWGGAVGLLHSVQRGRGLRRDAARPRPLMTTRSTCSNPAWPGSRHTP